MSNACSCDNIVDTSSQGMLFMLPVAKGKSTKGRKDVWLPVWGWVEADWGTFNYNAEWQGPIPGMKAYVCCAIVCFVFRVVYCPLLTRTSLPNQ